MVSYGRLGETLKESKTRYGKVTDTSTSKLGTKFYGFSKNGFEIAITLDPKGKNQAIHYYKKPTSDNPNGEFTPDEIDNLLKVESGKENWKEQEVPTDAPKKPRKVWYRSEGEIRGRYWYEVSPNSSVGDYQMNFYTKDYAVMVTEKLENVEKKKMKGF